MSWNWRRFIQLFLFLKVALFCFRVHVATIGSSFLPHYQHHCFCLVPGNVSDVTHNVMILGDETLIKITFQVSWFAPHHAWLHMCEIVTVYLTVLHDLFCSSMYAATFHGYQITMFGPLNLVVILLVFVIVVAVFLL